jgi:DNA end-binding protein Ku
VAFFFANLEEPRRDVSESSHEGNTVIAFDASSVYKQSHTDRSLHGGRIGEILRSEIPKMAARSSWKGYLKLSLVAVPVKAYNATTEATGIQLNQLHQECHSRIRYKKTCPIHGEVSNDEIVSGYEFSKDQYVVVDPDELKKLRPEGDKSIEIEKFIAADVLDPVYETGRTYYLVPDGPVGQKPYALIRTAMEMESYHAIAQVVIANREQLVRLRPVGQLIAMSVLSHAMQVKQPADFEDELVDTPSTKSELELTRQLIQAMSTKQFNIAEYPDTYVEKLSQLIQSKVEGQELVVPPAVAEPRVINLMEALKASVKQASSAAPASAAKKPARKMAEGGTKRSAAKKKSSSPKKRSG